MLINHHFTIPADHAGLRIDVSLAKLLPDYSRGQLQNWLKTGEIKINGQIWRPKDLVTGGEGINMQATPAEVISAQAEAIDLDIRFEDDDLMIINKPAGLVVHPGAGNAHGTLMNALLHYNTNQATLPRAGLIHRLDQDTSGLLIVAKNLKSHHHLTEALKDHVIVRQYQAIINGTLTGGGKVDLPIGRDPKQRTKMTVIANGRHAVTHFRLIERFSAHTHIQLQLETGRTHQIRVHMAHRGNPIVGDQTYCRHTRLPKAADPILITALQQFKRQALHAFRIALPHPSTQEIIEVTAPLPDDITGLLVLLRQHEAASKS